MGLFLRKAFRIGPLRLNVSNRGVGHSVGVTGLRVGKTAGGEDYVAGGRGGLYFREKIRGDGSAQAEDGGAFFGSLLTSIFLVFAGFISIVGFVLLVGVGTRPAGAWCVMFIGFTMFALPFWWRTTKGRLGIGLFVAFTAFLFVKANQPESKVSPSPVHSASATNPLPSTGSATEASTASTVASAQTVIPKRVEPIYEDVQVRDVRPPYFLDPSTRLFHVNTCPHAAGLTSRAMPSLAKMQGYTRDPECALFSPKDEHVTERRMVNEAEVRASEAAIQTARQVAAQERAALFAPTPTPTPDYAPSSSLSKSSGGPVQVRGYTKKDGTYVAPHTRKRPN